MRAWEDSRREAMKEEDFFLNAMQMKVSQFAFSVFF